MTRSDDPVEDGLLDAIARAPADEHARSVYQDWLEEHGHTDRLAFLKDETLGELFAAPSDAPWRTIVSSPPIRNCARACGGRWNQLAPTDNDLIRTCATCDRPVVYCPAIQRPPIPFVADAAVARDFDRLPDVPIMPTNPPAPRRQIVVPSDEPPQPGAFVRVLNWFRRR